jgi:hypothetical protein
MKAIPPINLDQKHDLPHSPCPLDIAEMPCYPKYQKNVQEVKPSSSELSYLLYYASARRSKLQKVGAFLEKKTASDVYMRKLG